MDYVEKLNKLVVKITSKGNLQGSGIIFLPNKESKEVFIITAKHCIYGEKFDNDAVSTDVAIENLYIANGTKNKYNLRNSDKILCYESNDKDIAVLVTPTVNISMIIGEIPIMKLKVLDASEQRCSFKGYPKATNNVEARTIKDVDIIHEDSNSSIFQINTVQKLSNELNLTKDIVKGYSGSGVFIHSNDNIYLIGIISEIEDWNNRFSCVSIQCINELLDIKIEFERGIVVSENTLLNPNPFNTFLKKEILALLSDKNLINNSDTVFSYRLKNLSINPPKPIANGSLRKEKVSEIIQLFETHSWVAFQGINGTGKSELASLICSEYKNVCWLDLKSFNQSIENTTLMVEIFLDTIASSPFILSRKALINNLYTPIPQDTLVVFNDLPRIYKDSSLSRLLISFVESISHTGIKVLTTSNEKIPSYIKQSLADDSFFEYYDFNFTDSEIIEYLINNDADDSIANYIDLIIVISQRNPRIVSAIIYHLKSMYWGNGSNSLLEVILKKEFSYEILEDAQSSIKKYIRDEKSRELLYRLSLIHWSFKINEVKFISEVKEKIAHPNEKLHDLINIWIQKHGDSYQISPLIYDIGKTNLDEDVIQNTHLAIAKSILSTKKLDEINASRCITSFMAGNEFNQAGLVLLTVYESVKTKDEIIRLEKWGYLNYWSELDIPKRMDAILRAYIRNEQIRLYSTIEKDTTFLHNRLLEYILEDSLSVQERTLIHIMSLLNTNSDNLSTYWFHLNDIIRNWQSLENAHKSLISGEVFISTLWIPVQYMASEEDIKQWLEFVGLFEDQFKIDFFENEISQSAFTVLSNKIVNIENSKQDKNWIAASNLLNFLASYFKKRNAPILEAVFIKEVVALEFEILKNKDKAEELVVNKAKSLTSNTAQYLLYSTIGKLYFNDKNILKSKEWLLKALEFDCTSQIDFTETLIYAASAISQSDSAKAVELCERAFELVRPREEFIELDKLQVLGELGIAYWINGNFIQSFEAFEHLVNRLFEIKSEQFGEYWIRIFSWTGHALGYISASVGKERVPKYVSNGGEYTKPYQGILSFNNKNLSDLYNEKNDSLMMAHLALFADGIHNKSKAYHWTRQAIEYAKKKNDNKIYLMILMICSQYPLINLEIEEAFDSCLITSAILSHNIKNFEKIELESMYASKPSEKWDFAEETTFLYAITPIFIIILTAHLENFENKNELYERFRALIQNYIPNASNKTLWEAILDICSQIVERRISETELMNKSNNYSYQEKLNLQILCLIGITFISKNNEQVLMQMINIAPYFTRMFSSSNKSIVKFVLFPFLKNRCLNITKNAFVGNKSDLQKSLNNIENVKLFDENAIQAMLQIVVRELDIKVEGDRKLWLYDFIQI